ncbi:hypothetical protein [Methylosinus sp. sav-2]|uniref:hypothetical protein n=1 Tax=Methylosinus sp. sav-2 TaxID=2485168 RepID=UPI001066C7B7|nr:hypothetical protein [Methylosinus sp. sav-2]
MERAIMDDYMLICPQEKGTAQENIEAALSVNIEARSILNLVRVSTFHFNHPEPEETEDYVNSINAAVKTVAALLDKVSELVSDASTKLRKEPAHADG